MLNHFGSKPQATMPQTESPAPTKTELEQIKELGSRMTQILEAAAKSANADAEECVRAAVACVHSAIQWAEKGVMH